MLSQDIDAIDYLINSFKARAKDKGALNIDIRFVLLLDVIRFELLQSGKMSDLTAGAVNSLFVFQAHEFFFRDFPEIYAECSALNLMLMKYNEKYLNLEKLPMPGVDEKKWVKYFHNALETLIKSNKVSIDELNATNTGLPK